MPKRKTPVGKNVRVQKEAGYTEICKSNSVAETFGKLRHLIGNTPLLELHFIYRGGPRVVYAKAEYLNFTGSIKDRMALHILKRAYEKGAIHQGDCIAEATSGNTGIAFSAIGRCLGHPVVIFMPNWMSHERIELIKSLGADIRLVTREQGGFLGSIRLTEELAKCEHGIFLPCQFSNEANIEAHETTTGPEIWWQLASRQLQPGAFVAGVGTGGTIMGVGRYFKRMKPDVKIHPLEPAESPTLSTGHKVGVHRIQGISDEFIPAIVKLDELDGVVSVCDGDAILAAQKISAQLGLAVGISSGANFLGALKIQELMGPGKIVVTVFADDNKKYLSTDLMKQEPVKDGYLTPSVEFTGLRALKRDCHVCCDGEDCFQRQLRDQRKSG
ncbi:MAG TPA: cysteine synthase family protein [bacterium]